MALTVANYREKKDYPNLLRSARIVKDSGAPIRWFVVGQGPLEGQVQGLHRELGLEPEVTLLGYRSDVPRLLGGADLLVIGSRLEGLPVTVMEACAVGLPVVTTAVGGLPDAVLEGVNGLVVSPGRPDLLAAAVERVAADPELRRTLSEGASRMADRFDISRGWGPEGRSGCSSTTPGTRAPGSPSRPPTWFRRRTSSSAIWSGSASPCTAWARAGSGDSGGRSGSAASSSAFGPPSSTSIRR
jgi:Glycosyl transferases group 1